MFDNQLKKTHNGLICCLNFVGNKIKHSMKSDKELKETEIREKYITLKDYLDERTLRIWAATEIKQIGRFGKTIVKKATGMDYKTLNKGLKESEQTPLLDTERIRNEGGGRKKTLKRTRH